MFVCALGWLSGVNTKDWCISTCPRHTLPSPPLPLQGVPGKAVAREAMTELSLNPLVTSDINVKFATVTAHWQCMPQ